MDNNRRYAPEEEILCAIELVYEQEDKGILSSDLFGLEHSRTINIMGCILETDKVFLMGARLELAALLISYLYTPECLELQGTEHTEQVKSSGRKRNLLYLLGDYHYSELIYRGNGMDSMLAPDAYNVVISGYAERTEGRGKTPAERFLLETGTEYEQFNKDLVSTDQLLKTNGRWIVLAKPSWILKSWELIQDRGLQLEYDQFRLYTELNRHPNTFLWLRFIKNKDQFNIEQQKKNLLSMMEDNGIDRLYAHRNQLRFPYAELSFRKSEAYVDLKQNAEYLQYFFSVETTKRLTELCTGYTACLVTPSVAQCAYRNHKNVVLFERDNRFRENGGLKFVKYDLNKGLTKFVRNKYANKFDRVICDPPFDIDLNTLAEDIEELILLNNKSTAYVVFPDSRSVSLINSMKSKGFIYMKDSERITIEYARPPKIVRVGGKNAIQLYKFIYTGEKSYFSS